MSVAERYEDYSWHDNAIHGLCIVEGSDGCSGELILDIDYIIEWLPPQGEENAFEFRIAPANLTFHEVTDLVISIDYASSTAALQPMTIHEIHREAVSFPTGYSSFAWRVEINWPRNSFISFSEDAMTPNPSFQRIVKKLRFLSSAEFRRWASS